VTVLPKKDLGLPCNVCARPATVAVCSPREDPVYFCSEHEPSELPEGCTRFSAEQLPAGSCRLLFRSEDVARLTAFGREICWAKDTGTYLGVWDEGGLLAAASAYTVDGLCLDDSVTYSEDNTKFDEIWETTRDICGSDDFLESGIEFPAAPAGARWLVMDVSPETITLHWE